jgi:WD40 repeat protein
VSSHNPPSMLDKDNPWPGLTPFDEADSAFFHGRQLESAELLRLIEREALTVLFGRSGLGKTSLLKAGVFPALRAGDYLPVYLRLDHADSAPPLRVQVLRELHAACAAHGVQAQAMDEQASLWACFHRRELEFWNRDNRLVTPVIVFDQFEEIFTIGQEHEAARVRAGEFLAELADLVENRPPQSVKNALALDSALAAQYEFRRSPVKLVLSFREDFLAEMEDLKRAMPSLMYNRQRLLPLAGAQAYAVVRESGGVLVDDEVARCMLRLAWKNEPQPPVGPGDFERIEIDPALLCVVCSELNHKRQQAGAPQITRALLAGADREILNAFYERGMAGLDARVRAFVEDELITARGYRDSHDLGDALGLPGMDQTAVDALVARRLLRVDERQGQKRLELTHDVLTRVVKDSRDKRRAREAEAVAQAREQAARAQQRKNRRNALLIFLGLIAMLALVGVASWQTKLAHDTKLLAEKLRQDANGAQAIAHEQQTRADTASLRAKIDSDRVKQAMLEVATASEKAASANAQATRLQHLATEQQTKANQLLVDARNLRLMAAADRLQDSQYDLSLLLNLEALRHNPTPDAEAGLLRRFHSHPHLATHLHHSASVKAVAFSPDGKLLATSGANGVVLWDAVRAQALATLADRKTYTGDVAFSADGKLLASAGNGGVYVWEVASRRLLTILGKEWVDRVLFRPDGKLLAGNFSDKTQIWVVETGKLFSETNLRHSYSSAFSHDGQQLINAADTGQIQVWNIGTEKMEKAFAIGKKNVSHIAQNADGTLLAIGSDDGSVAIWDMKKAAIQANLAGHKERVKDLVFSPDGKWLASCGADGVVLVWDAAGGALVANLAGHEYEINRIAFSPDSKRLASAGGDNRVLLWDLATRKATVTASVQQASTSALSPDGGKIAQITEKNTVQIQDLLTGKTLPTLPLGIGSFYTLVWSTDGTQLALPDDKGNVVVWNAASGSLVARLPGHKDYVGSIAFSPDGKLLAVGGRNQPVLLWDIAHGKTLAMLPHETTVWALAFSPNGRWLVSGTADGSVRLWRVQLRQEPRILQRNKRPTHALCFRPDGKILATGSDDATMRLWDMVSGRNLATISSSNGWITNCIFSPNGKRLAIDNTGGKIFLWDLSTPIPQQLVKFERASSNQYRLNNMVFSADGKALISTNNDNTVSHWQLTPGTLALEACRTANRNLSCAEWQQYIGTDLPCQKTCESLPAPAALGEERRWHRYYGR